jgi:Zn-dependent peptidase ImmA (M78 family)/transcriptional regulator with XRE-family HTH domain
MTNVFNPEMLILAREVRGITQSRLAEITNIPQGNISMYESSLREIRPNHLTTIAEILAFPEAFFFREGKIRAVESAAVFHRKRQSITKSSLSKLDAAINLLRLDIEKLFQAADVEPALEIPQYHPEDYGNDMEYIAALVRTAWEIPSLPGQIRNLVGYLEAAGCVVLLIDFQTDKMDAVSQWKDPSPPVVLMSNSINGERQRFSLAHELGHLVMHRNLEPYEDMEIEADQFASAFLMPADRISLELPPVTIEHMLQIKSSWKVSVKALIRRARDLDIIGERRYTSLQQDLSRMGYSRIEPFPLAAEKPTLLTSLLSHFQKNLDHSLKDIADLLRVHEDDLLERYIKPQDDLFIVPRSNQSQKKKNGQSGTI